MTGGDRDERVGQVGWAPWLMMMKCMSLALGTSKASTKAGMPSTYNRNDGNVTYHTDG